MSGAIGQKQLKKLPCMVAARRENARYFVERFSNHPWLKVQVEVGESSWFGFSLLLSEDSPVDRSTLMQKLIMNRVDVRPIVAGNFAKNEVLKWFDYSVHSELKNAEYVDKNGFFVGNHHYSLRAEIDYLHSLLI